MTGCDVKSEGLAWMLGTSPEGRKYQAKGFPESLRRLHVAGNQLTSEDVLSLLKRYPNLEVSSDEQAGSILSGVKAAITKLELSGRGLTADDMPLLNHLLQTDTADRLESVWIDNNPIGDDGFLCLLDRLSSLPRLQELCVTHMGLTDNIVGSTESPGSLTRAILDKGSFRSLGRLRLRGNKISSRGQDTLKAAWHSSRRKPKHLGRYDAITFEAI